MNIEFYVRTLSKFSMYPVLFLNTFQSFGLVVGCFFHATNTNSISVSISDYSGQLLLVAIKHATCSNIQKFNKLSIDPMT